jgi:hypothetical protein
MDELEQFKQINLAEYLQHAEGYELDKKNSSQNAPILRNAQGEKLLISRKSSGHYVYCSVHDDSDNGTIIDFLQSRHSLNLGHVRKKLRGYNNTERPDIGHKQKHIEPIKKDFEAVRRDIARFKPFISPYLESRGIPRAVLEHDRFKNRILQGDRGNTVFPHSNMQGVCGYENKNRGFTGFSRAAIKGLWYSTHNQNDTHLAFFETAIDAVSYGAAHPDKLDFCTFYSLAGKPSPLQKELIAATIGRFPNLEAVILGFDNDADGLRLEADIMAVLEPLAGGRFTIVCDRPPQVDTDWNDFLGLTPVH